MSTERLKYKIVGAATWELIRAAYLGGESAPALAERFGVSHHAIRKRITTEGWTKRDYAASLEARGIRIERPAKPNYIEEGVLREEMRVAAENAEAAKRDAETHAWIEQVAAEEEAFDIADALERRALAQASAALVQGRSKDAQALASLAEQMRKRKTERVVAQVARPVAAQPALSAEDLAASVQAQLREAIADGRVKDAKALTEVAEQLKKNAEGERAAEAAVEEQRALEADERVAAVMEIFGRAAFLAGAMVHQPTSAPAAFLRMIKRWRELNLGEGEADAELAAMKAAKAKQHHLDGSWLENTPEDVKDYWSARWEEVRRTF